jgi:predicted transcriptional regulator
MTCGLSEDELAMLNYLYTKRNLSSKKSRSVLAIERVLRDRLDVEEVLQSLLNKGYIRRYKKHEWNYFAVPGPTMRALGRHGYPVGNRS